MTCLTMTVLWIFLVFIVVIGIIIIMSLLPVFGQNTTPAPVAPTPVPTPTPTTPNPNWQFLPQKAYVIPFAPEQGVPQSAIPLQSVPTIIPQQGQGQLDTSSIMGIIGIVGAAGASLFAKLNRDKVNKVQDTTKENSASIVDSKVVQQEIARYMFNLDKAKADALNDAPAIKLEKLEQDKKEATDTATKA